MKVAIISKGKPTLEYPINGVFEFDQAKALAAEDIEVAFVVIDFRIWTDKRKYGLFQYQCEGVHVFELSLPLNVYRRAIPILQQLLLIPFRAMLKSFGKPDIIHTHFYSIAAIASILKTKYNIPYIITEHSSKLNRPNESISNLDKRLAIKAYRNCDQLITVSNALRNNIIQNFGQDSIVIPNLVDPKSFSFKERPKDTSPFVFVAVGNLKPIKAFDLLIEAFSKLDDDTMLYIIGAGPQREKLQTQIQILGLQKRVKLIGQLERSEINRIFQKSHVFVLASQSETFGVCFIEAMYAGLPVIATRCGGPESFVNSSNGLLVPTNDATALAEAMNDIRHNYTHYDPKRISEDCLNRFSPTIVAKQIIEVYRSKIL